MDRMLNPEFGSHQPTHAMIQIASGSPAVMVVRLMLHGRMMLVNGIEMPNPATRLAAADAY